MIGFMSRRKSPMCCMQEILDINLKNLKDDNAKVIIVEE